MSWLAKKLGMLFFITAFILILLVAAFNYLPPGTIIKRIVIGSVFFGLLGLGIGELLARELKGGEDNTNKIFPQQNPYNSNGSKGQLDDHPQKNPSEAKTDQRETGEGGVDFSLGEEIEPLSLDQVDETEENIINKAKEAPEEVAEMIQTMNEEE